jgi:hypothetical protein
MGLSETDRWKQSNDENRKILEKDNSILVRLRKVVTLESVTEKGEMKRNKRNELKR